jgi:sugar transferase EpsL
MHKAAWKRAIDLSLTIPGFIVLTPLMLVIGLFICATMGRPLFFRHPRPGINGQPFMLYKFRTMTNERDESGKLLPDKKRLTRLGKLLRATSLDELPELFNVMVGDMSLVGPRPLLMSYLGRYTDEQAKRHAVKPGLTGWAQVNGRNAITWDEKFRLDVWYVNHHSIRLDLKILGLTIKKVLKREGIRQPGHATAAEFRGRCR